jgi:hypothetical protein
MSEPAKLDPQFIKEPEPRLEDLKPGESGNVYWNDMAVDQEYRCYIDPKARVIELTLSMIQVTRTEEGFEVLIPASPLAPLRWELGAYNPQADEDYARYVPVVRIEYAKAEKRHKSTEGNLAEAERNLAFTQKTNREIAELQKQIHKQLKRLRDKGDESSGGQDKKR